MPPTLLLAPPQDFQTFRHPWMGVIDDEGRILFLFAGAVVRSAVKLHAVL